MVTNLLNFNNKPHFGQRFNSNHWARKGLVAHWPFIRHGRLIDVSGNGNHGNLRAQAVWTTQGVDCVSDGIDLDNSIANVTGSGLTVIAKITPHFDSTDTSSNKYLFDGDGGNVNQFRLLFRSSAEWRFRLHTSTSSLNFDVSPTAFNAEETFYIAFVYDGGTMYVYQNGIEIGSTSHTGVIDSATPSSKGIGNDGGGSNEINAIIRDFRMYNRGLSPSQIQEFTWNEYPEYKTDLWLGRVVAPPVGAPLLRRPIDNHLRHLLTR